MTSPHHWISLAESKSIITSEQGALLRDMVQSHDLHSTAFSWHHILYYLGGFICIGAMSLFLTLGWQHIGAPAVFSLSLLYTASAYIAMRHLHKSNLHTPASLAGTFIVCITPLCFYSLLWLLEMWPGEFYPEHPGSMRALFQWNWLVLELSAISAALWLLRAYSYPLLVMPLSIAIYLFLMESINIITGANRYGDLLQTPSLVAGLIVCALAVCSDLKLTRGKNYSFWLYTTGATAIWFPLTYLLSSSLFEQFVYAVLCIVMLAVGAIVRRIIFVVYGGLGLAWFLTDLAHTAFKDSALFPVLLTFIGALVVYTGIVWQKRQTLIHQHLQSILPERISVKFSDHQT